MTETLQFDIFDSVPEGLRRQESRRLRDTGIQRAYDHAEDDEPAWGERAYRLLLEFIASTADDTFMTEDVRLWARPRLVAPPDNRAWGHVALRAAKSGLIIKHGYAAQKDPKHHMAPGTVWRIKR